MSTILKALKKLEQETQAAAAAAALPSIEAESAGGVAKRRRQHIWIGCGIGTGLIGLGLVLFLLLRPTTPPTGAPPKGLPVPAAPPLKTAAPGGKLPMPKVFPPPKPGDHRTASTEAARVRTKAATEAAAAAGVDPAKRAPHASQPKTVSERATSLPADAQSARPTSSPKAMTAAMPRPQPAMPPPSRQKKTAGVVSAGSQAVAPAVAPAVVPAATPADSQTPSKAAPPPPPAPEKPFAGTEQKPVPAANSAPAKAATSAKAAEAPRDTATAQAAVDPFASVPPLEANSPIKLQAISWDQPADKSITVINNSVLHEGDSVEGYTVVKIRPDDVILRRSGRMWRATFSLR